MSLLTVLLRYHNDHVVSVRYASIVPPDQGLRLERARVLHQGNVPMALDRTSRVKRLNQVFVTFVWLVFSSRC